MTGRMFGVDLRAGIKGRLWMPRVSFVSELKKINQQRSEGAGEETAERHPRKKRATNAILRR